MPGFLKAFFLLSMNESIPQELRLAAAIALKNAVHEEWLKTSDEEGKTFLRDNLVDAISVAPKRIMKLHRYILQQIVFNDYPKKMPNLLSQISSHLHSPLLQNRLGAMNSLFVILDQLSAFYHIKNLTGEDLVAQTSQPMLELCEAILIENNLTADNGELMRRILRNFFLFMYNKTFSKIAESEFFARWMKVLFSMYSLELPTPHPSVMV